MRPTIRLNEVSTHAIALVLAQARGLPGLFGATRQGIWNSESGGILYRLSNQTLGVVGCGRIGQATAAKGRGLGLEVLVYDPYVDAAAMEKLGVQVVDLETVLRKADYISLHSPLTEETRHLINAEDAGADEADRLPGERGARRVGRRGRAAGSGAERPDCGRCAGRVGGRTGGGGPSLSAGRAHLAHAPCGVVFWRNPRSMYGCRERRK